MNISGYGTNGGSSAFYSAMPKTPSAMIRQQAEQSPQSAQTNLPKTAVVPNGSESAKPQATALANQETKTPYQEAVEQEEKANAREKKQQDAQGCQTCENRKYQDGSNDPSVSFKTPTNVDPAAAASAVKGHEMEHVFHEQSKAQRDQRKIISQTVALHTGICGECGRVYISGGTTRTVSKADTAKAVEQYKKNSEPVPKGA